MVRFFCLGCLWAALNQEYKTTVKYMLFVLKNMILGTKTKRLWCDLRVFFKDPDSTNNEEFQVNIT